MRYPKARDSQCRGHKSQEAYIPNSVKPVPETSEWPFQQQACVLAQGLGHGPSFAS